MYPYGCEMVASMYAALRHIGTYFVKYQSIVLEIKWMVLSMENLSWEIFGDTCSYKHVS